MKLLTIIALMALTLAGRAGITTSPTGSSGGGGSATNVILTGDVDKAAGSTDAFFTPGATNKINYLAYSNALALVSALSNSVTTLAVVIGDSMSDDDGIPGSTGWVQKMRLMTNWQNGAHFVNMGVSSDTVSNDIKYFTARYGELLTPVGASKKYLFVMKGYNDFSGATTVATVEGWLTNIYARFRSNGYAVVAMTIPYTNNANVSNLNARIVADSSTYDYLINAAALSPTFVDGVHFDAATATKISTNIQANIPLTGNVRAGETFTGDVNIMPPSSNPTAYRPHLNIYGPAILYNYESLGWWDATYGRYSTRLTPLADDAGFSLGVYTYDTLQIRIPENSALPIWMKSALNDTNGFGSDGTHFRKMETNAPVDGYVSTATGTDGSTAWKPAAAAQTNDLTKVSKAGDTMTGALTNTATLVVSNGADKVIITGGSVTATGDLTSGATIYGNDLVATTEVSTPQINLNGETRTSWPSASTNTPSINLTNSSGYPVGEWNTDRGLTLGSTNYLIVSSTFQDDGCNSLEGTYWWNSSRGSYTNYAAASITPNVEIYFHTGDAVWKLRDYGDTMNYATGPSSSPLGQWSADSGCDAGFISTAANSINFTYPGGGIFTPTWSMVEGALTMPQWKLRNGANTGPLLETLNGSGFAFSLDNVSVFGASDNRFYISTTNHSPILIQGYTSTAATDGDALIFWINANAYAGVVPPIKFMSQQTTYLTLSTNGALFNGSLNLQPLSAVSTSSIVANTARIYARTNSGVVEIFVAGSDRVETQISPHADDAPPQLYDKQAADMKEIIFREQSDYVTNGQVSFINLRRMARQTELNTKAILYLAGVNTTLTSNALVRLKAQTIAERQVLMTEDFATYNARTGNNLTPRNWAADQSALQAEYDATRSNQVRLAAIALAAGKTNFNQISLLPEADIRQPKPDWIK